MKLANWLRRLLAPEQESREQNPQPIIDHEADTVRNLFVLQETTNIGSNLVTMREAYKILSPAIN